MNNFNEIVAVINKGFDNFELVSISIFKKKLKH